VWAGLKSFKTWKIFWRQVVCPGPGHAEKKLPRHCPQTKKRQNAKLLRALLALASWALVAGLQSPKIKFRQLDEISCKRGRQVDNDYWTSGGVNSTTAPVSGL
jgi:hypothetical protein